MKIEFSCDFSFSSVILFYSLLSMIVFVFLLMRAMYPAILFRIFLLGNILPSVFLFSSNVFPNDSFEFSVSCRDVLLINVDLIRPMISRVCFGF